MSFTPRFRLGSSPPISDGRHLRERSQSAPCLCFGTCGRLSRLGEWPLAASCQLLARLHKCDRRRFMAGTLFASARVWRPPRKPRRCTTNSADRRRHRSTAWSRVTSRPFSRRLARLMNAGYRATLNASCAPTWLAASTRTASCALGAPPAAKRCSWRFRASCEASVLRQRAPHVQHGRTSHQPGLPGCSHRRACIECSF